MPRKTRDVYQIHVNYGYGWEEEIEEETKAEAIEQLKTYRANCNYPCKIVVKRERIA